VPVLRDFRGRLEAVRAAELERALKHLPDLTAVEREHVEHLSQALLNKFLHQPTVALKAAAQDGRGYALLDALRRLFGLETPKE
jgi:glutamyl-tRNA reductase